MFRELSAPLSVQWEITSACPKRCFYCANYWRHGNDKSESDLSSPKKISHIVNQIIDAGVFKVIITGGEPLLVVQRVASELKRLSDANIKLSLNSTLSDISPDIIDVLLDIGISSALVSIPSYDPNTDVLITNTASSWEKTSRGIREAISHGMKLCANMVVCRHNSDQVFDTAKYARSLGIMDFAATKMSHPSTHNDLTDAILTSDQFQSMARQLQRVKHELGMRVSTVQSYAYCGLSVENIREDIPSFNSTCSAAKTFCMISPSGLVRPCPLVSDSYGSVLTSGGLIDAWQSMKSWRDDSFMPSECSNCMHKATCAGGCKADAKSAYGSYSSPDPYCRLSAIPIIPQRERIWEEHLAQYQFNSKIKSRFESFGGILYQSDARWLAVDSKLYNLSQRQDMLFTREDFATALGVSLLEADKTMTLLLEKKILIEV